MFSSPNTARYCLDGTTDKDLFKKNKREEKETKKEKSLLIFSFKIKEEVDILGCWGCHSKAPQTGQLQ